jgi:acetyl esterase
MIWDYEADGRMDPRVKYFLKHLDFTPTRKRFSSREELLEDQDLAASIDGTKVYSTAFKESDLESFEASTRLQISKHEISSEPDGNTICMQLMRPETEKELPCVYFIHGGGMCFGTCFDVFYQAWARLLASHNIIVSMVDFRNAWLPSTAAQVAPFPAGLNDCVSGLKWLHQNAAAFQVDPSRIVIAGDSGGGNLALAVSLKLKSEGSNGLLKGIFTMCPFIAGRWPDSALPSTIDNDGIFLTSELLNALALAYADGSRDPLAWPLLAAPADLAGLPPVVVTVHECDPLRDEGIALYRRLLAAGVPASCRQIHGVCHAVETLMVVCPDVTRAAARDLAAFAAD